MRHFFKILFCFCLLLILAIGSFAQIPGEVIPGGMAIGIRLQTDGVYIAGFSEDGVSPAKDAGLQIGDRIVQIGDMPVQSIDDIPTAVRAANGERLPVRVLRGGTSVEVSVQPKRVEGDWKLGLSVRDSVAGIGTLTYYDPESGRFGALGHPVNDPSGRLVPIRDAQAYPVEITQIRRAEHGQPGSLIGSYLQEDALGSITQNSAEGVFGELHDPISAPPVPVAPAAELEKGPASILCTVSGTEVEEFSVEITAVRPNDPNRRNLQLHVTDEALLAATGGIVQGISGAPILQNGKLIGAVTHVLVDQPTRGYGIYIGNMLDSAQPSSALSRAA